MNQPTNTKLAIATLLTLLLMLCAAPAGVAAQDELCNALDDDGDSLIDEDFDIGAVCSVASGPCATGGTKVCTADGLGTECHVDGPLIEPHPEGPAGAASCFDHVDNDCDGLTDHADPDCTTDEICNGFDDDNDGTVDEGFPDLGHTCMVGIGNCRRSGVRICSADGLTTTCSAVPAPAGVEGPPGNANCGDADDDDCDGLVDLADPDCLAPESCDGVDNDGDGDIDEDFDIGAPCSEGTGTCLVNGEKICLPDHSGTFCNAMPLPPQPEGPAGATCSDGLDNDCDGLVDGADANCNSSGLAATCALPILRGEPGKSCAAWHRLQFGALNATPTTVVTGELLAVDQTGAILGSIPVENGDEAHLLSGLDKVQLRSHKGRHEVKAPIPMLRVTVNDGVRQVRAYCSNLPFLDIVEPAGGLGTVVTQGAATSVTVALPLVDPASLTVTLDGVDVLAALGINPATDLPGGPFSGAVLIGSDPVSVDELIVESGPLTVASSNTLRMQVGDLGGGGHIVRVNGDARAGSLPQHGSIHCLEDDLADDVRIDAFEVVVTRPAAGEVVSDIPTQVSGEVRHGLPIASLSINGLAQDVSGQTLEPGPGTGAFVLPINALIDRTDLLADIQGLNTSLGTFDPGPNRLVVEARDDLGTQAFASHTFAVGNLIHMASLATVASLKASAPISSKLGEIQTLDIGEGAEVTDALVLGLAPDSVQKIFAQFCVDHADQIIETMSNEAMNLGANPGLTDTLPKTAEIDGACDPDLKYAVCPTCVTFADVAPSCSVMLGAGQLMALVTLPDMTINMKVTGGCSTFLWHEIDVDTDVTVTATGITGMLTLNQDDFLLDKIMKDIHIDIGNVHVDKDDHSSFSGVGFGLILEVLDFIGKIFTLGYVDDLGFKLQIFLTTLFKGLFSCLDFDCNFNFGDDDDMAAAFDVPLGDLLDGIGLNGDGFASAMLGFAAKVASVKIDPNGLTASLTAAFAPFMVDPEIPPIPGALETAATAPMPPIDMAQGFFAVSDDVVNQLLASLTAMGDFKSVCLPAGHTVGEFLPADCNTLGMPDPVTHQRPTAVLACEALKADSCATAPPDAFFTCLVLEGANLSKDTGVLMCGRLEIPPVLLIRDDIDADGNPVMTPNQIESTVRVNDLHVWIILDRNPDLVFTNLAALPSCLNFAQQNIALDCQFLEFCLDLNLATNLSLTMAPEGPSMELVVGAFQDLHGSRDPGYACNGEVLFIDVQTFLDAALMSDAVNDVKFSIDMPALTPEGLELMGIGQLTMLHLKGIRTSEAMPGFDDYLGLLGDFEVAPAALAEASAK